MSGDSASSLSGARFGFEPSSEHTKPMPPTLPVAPSPSPPSNGSNGKEEEEEGSDEKDFGFSSSFSGDRSGRPGLAASRPALTTSGSRVVEAEPVQPRQKMAAPQSPPGVKTIAARDPVLSEPSPVIVAETRLSMCSEDNVAHNHLSDVCG